MKIISLLILPAILLSQTTERSSIGSYWVGLGYDGYSDDLSDADHLFIDSNFPINPNVDIGVAGRIGSVSLPSNDLLSYGVFVDAKVHEKFDLGGISADPYFGVSLGFAALESYSCSMLVVTTTTTIIKQLQIHLFLFPIVYFWVLNSHLTVSSLLFPLSVLAGF